MSAKGWVKLHREIQNSEIFQDPDLLKLWVYSLGKASHSNRVIEFEGDLIPILSGQYITGRKVLAKEYNHKTPPKKQVADTTLWNNLKRLEKMGEIQIEAASSRKYSTVTILKWREYQSEKEEAAQPKAEKGSDSMDEFLEVGRQETGVTVKPKKEKKVYTKADIEFHLAARLFNRMLAFNPNVKKPNPQKWAETFSLMIRRDKRTPEEIASLIDWAQSNTFWKSNILSPDKLRKQYDTLYAQRKVELEKVSKGGYGGRGAAKNDMLRAMLEEEEAGKNGKIGNDKTLLIDN